MFLLTFKRRKGFDYLPDWTGDYYDALQQLSVDSLKQFVAYLHAPHADSPLADAACKSSYQNDDYFNDLIGTRLMAMGRFEEAIPYLKKVSTGNCIYNSNICGYTGRRNYQQPRWFVHQVIADTLQTGHSLRCHHRQPEGSHSVRTSPTCNTATKTQAATHCAPTLLTISPHCSIRPATKATAGISLITTGVAWTPCAPATVI